MTFLSRQIKNAWLSRLQLDCSKYIVIFHPKASKGSFQKRINTNNTQKKEQKNKTAHQFRTDIQINTAKPLQTAAGGSILSSVYVNTIQMQHQYHSQYLCCLAPVLDEDCLWREREVYLIQHVIVYQFFYHCVLQNNTTGFETTCRKSM